MSKESKFNIKLRKHINSILNERSDHQCDHSNRQLDDDICDKCWYFSIALSAVHYYKTYPNTELSRLKEKVKEQEKWMQNCPNCNELLRLKELVAVYEEALTTISCHGNSNQLDRQTAQSALSRGDGLKGEL